VVAVVSVAVEEDLPALVPALALAVPVPALVAVDRASIAWVN